MPIVHGFSLLDDGKVCSSCGRWKTYSEYRQASGYRDGYTGQCTPCRNAVIAACMRRKRAEDPEKYKREYAEWYAKQNKDYHRKWRNENRERLREQSKKRYAEDPEKNIAETLRRMALRRGSASGSHTLAEWKSLCARYGNRCLICQGKVKLTRDHIVPLTKGGTDSIDNIACICGPCNSRKSDRHLNCRPDRLLPAYSPPP